MESIERPLEELGLGPPDEGLLGTSGVGSQEEDKGLFDGMFVSLAVGVDKLQLIERRIPLPLGNEIGEVLPNEYGQVVGKTLRRYRLGSVELPGVFCH